VNDFGSILNKEKMMRKTKLIWLLVTLPILILSGSVLQAQYQISQSVFGNGGIPVSSAAYSINSTIGQAFIGKVQNASYQNDVGFWYSTRVYVGIEAIDDQLPKKFELYQNYPNPFNPVTQVVYEIPFSAYVQLSIHNVLGQKINTLVNGIEDVGTYRVQFDGSSLSSGVYFCRLTVNGTSIVKQFMLLH
jgi:hypothetical protein